jgi:tRNA(Arg) A34 adenosine deaminase TadA
MHEQYLRAAINLARDKMHAGEGGPFGAIIVREGEIVARGWNQVTSTNDPTAHAEVVAIRAACKSLKAFTLKGCVLYTSCEPCPLCLSAIYWARLDSFYYAANRHDAAEAGFDDEFLYRELTLPIDQRRLKAFQSLREEALGAFAEWKVKTDKVAY